MSGQNRQTKVVMRVVITDVIVIDRQRSDHGEDNNTSLQVVMLYIDKRTVD